MEKDVMAIGKKDLSTSCPKDGLTFKFALSPEGPPVSSLGWSSEEQNNYPSIQKYLEVKITTLDNNKVLEHLSHIKTKWTHGFNLFPQSVLRWINNL